MACGNVSRLRPIFGPQYPQPMTPKRKPFMIIAPQIFSAFKFEYTLRYRRGMSRLSHSSSPRRGSHKRKKAVQRVAKCHRKIANQRKDFQHKASHKLVKQYQIIVFEDLQVKNLTKAPAPKQDENGKYIPNGAAAKAGLNKSSLDAGWSTFTQMVSVKTHASPARWQWSCIQHEYKQSN
jgi:Probable transposase